MSRKTIFTPEEDKIIIEQYPKLQMMELSKLLPGKKPDTIHARATRVFKLKVSRSQVRIKRPDRKTWTEREDQFIKANYANMDNTSMAKVLGKTRKQISCRGYFFGLKKSAECKRTHNNLNPVNENRKVNITPKLKPVKSIPSTPVDKQSQARKVKPSKEMKRHLKAAKKAKSPIEKQSRNTKKNKQVFKTRKIDLTDKIPVKLDDKTTIYVKPGADIPKLINKFINRNHNYYNAPE